MSCLICKKSTKRYKTRKGFAKFCSKKCRYKAHSIRMKGSGNSNWGGGFFYRDGYKFIYSPHHPRTNNLGYVREHRLVMEKKLGRYLRPKEIVHHRDEDRSNNSIDNLELMSPQEHSSHHLKINVSCICGIHGSNKLRKGLCSKHYYRYFTSQYSRETHLDL